MHNTDKIITAIECSNRQLMWATGTFDTSFLCNNYYYFEVVEEQQNIDIQAIERLDEWVTRRNGEVTQTEGKILEIGNKVNELIKAIKQLDNKIKESK